MNVTIKERVHGTKYKFDKDDMSEYDVLALYHMFAEGLTVLDTKTRIEQFYDYEESSDWEEQTVAEEIWEDALEFIKGYTTQTYGVRSMSDEQFDSLSDFKLVL